jgi:Zn-dependent peptidase ImmA (M78 family)
VIAKTARQPEELARDLLSKLKIDPPANLDALACIIGLQIREVNSKGFEGALVRVPGRLRGIVAVRAGIREHGRKRFTIAHEIGHYLLPGHGSIMPICREDQVDIWTKESIRKEDAANRFASELLLPSDRISLILRNRNPSMATARFISNKFETSLISAALKCIEVTEKACALVVSVDGLVQRYRPSKSWRYLIPSGQTLSRMLAGELHYYSRQIQGKVAGSTWLSEKSVPKRMMLLEDSIFLPHYNTVLSFLTEIR